jgi:WD40 repeat protein
MTCSVLQGTPWPYAKGGIKNIRGTPAVCLAWHPEKQLLAVAWQDGAVSLWDAAKCHLEEDSKTHRQQISQLIWHPDEKHFMTADNQGKVCVVLVYGGGAVHAENLAQAPL